MHIINNKCNNFNATKTIFGFWLYIMSDCILFASLFAVYAVLNASFADLPIIKKDIFKLNFIFIETLCLLCSSFTCSKSIAYATKMYIQKTIAWMIITLLLGLSFIGLEIQEFLSLIKHQYNPSSNAFFSSFFVLIGTHGIHVIAGLIWIVIMITNIIYQGLTHYILVRLQCFSLFWHFLDIIWICVFTEVYLIGVL